MSKILKVGSGWHSAASIIPHKSDKHSYDLIFRRWHKPCCCSSAAVASNSLQPHGPQRPRLFCSLLFSRVCSNSWPLCQWCHPTVSPFSSCPQFLPASGSFPVSHFFASDGQSIGASVSVSVGPMNIQGWFPLRSTGLISLQSKGLSRVFSSVTVQKHESFGSQPFLWSNSHFHTWLLEKP